MMAASKTGEKVGEMDAITSRLTQTNLTEDNPRPATDPTAGAAEMEVIANRLSQAALEKDGVDPGSEEVHQTQEAEAVAKAAVAKQKKAAHKQKKADQRTSAALSAACDKWSINDDKSAKVKKEAKQTQDRLQQEHADRMQALEDAEASRQADAKHTALMKRLMETRAQARLDKKNHEAEEAKTKEAAQQKQAEADALAVRLAKRRATLEREWHEQALANRAKQEADNKLRQEMSKAYHDIIAHNAVLAEANAQEEEWRRRQAEYLACYQAAVSGQAQNAGLVQQQQHHHHHHHHHPQQEQQQQQQQQPSSFGSVVSEMEVDEVENAGKATEAIGETDMDWEPVEKGFSLPAPTLVPLVPPMGLRDDSLASEAGFQPPAIAAPPLVPRSDQSAGRKKANTVTAVSSKRAIAKGVRRKDRARTKSTRTSSPASSREAATIALTATPASPPQSSPPTPEVLEADLPRAPINPVIRPTVYPWSPLGRLLSQGQSIPQVVQAQVLGKREREDMDEAEPPKKKAKLEGEFQSQVGKKRKREDEEFLPERKRTRLDLAPAPTLAPPIVPASGVADPPKTPPPTQPVTTAIPLPANRSGSMAETIAFVNDLPTLRAEIAWMRAYRNTGKATRGKKTHTVNPIIKRAPTRADPGYWEKYRET